MALAAERMKAMRERRRARGLRELRLQRQAHSHVWIEYASQALTEHGCRRDCAGRAVAMYTSDRP